MGIASRLGVNLRRIRAKRGLAQEGLARAAGVSRSTIAAIEGGRYRSVDTATIERLARALNLGTAELTERRRTQDSPKAS